MSTKPRTPEHFPRMKHRAAGRIAKQERQQVVQMRTFKALEAIAEIVGGVVMALTDGVIAFADALTKIFTPAPKQSDYVLVPPPLIPSRTFALTEAAPDRAASFMPGDIVTVNNPGSSLHGRVGRVRHRPTPRVARIDFGDLTSYLVRHEHLTEGEQEC